MKGVGSITQDALHVMFFDFDNKTLKQIKQIMKPLQTRYDLSDCLIFKTSENNYHGIILDKLTFGAIIDIHQDMEKYDTSHDMHAVKRGYWVLRITDKQGSKIVYETTLKNLPKIVSWTKSNAHRILLNKLYDLEILKTAGYDDYEHLCFDDYPTLKKK